MNQRKLAKMKIRITSQVIVNTDPCGTGTSVGTTYRQPKAIRSMIKWEIAFWNCLYHAGCRFSGCTPYKGGGSFGEIADPPPMNESALPHTSQKGSGLSAKPDHPKSFPARFARMGSNEIDGIQAGYPLKGPGALRARNPRNLFYRFGGLQIYKRGDHPEK